MNNIKGVGYVILAVIVIVLGGYLLFRSIEGKSVGSAVMGAVSVHSNSGIISSMLTSNN